MELIQKLVSEVGLSEEQARGATGLLLKVAKGEVGGDEFTKLKDAVPHADELMTSAPETEEGGLFAKASKAFGGGGGLATFAAGCSKLGIEPTKLQKIVPKVVEFLRQRSPEAASVLSKLGGGHAGSEAEAAPPSI